MRTASARPHGRGRLQLNARLVREKDRARLRELRRLGLYGAAIVIPLLIYVWQRVDFIRTSYSLEALNHEQQKLQEQNKEYILERSSLLAPDRIEKVARKQLGLSEPTPEDVRRVQVIDGRVNEIGATLASLPPPASQDVVEPAAADRSGTAAAVTKNRSARGPATERRAAGTGAPRDARQPREGAGAGVYAPASILPALPPPDKPEEPPQ